MHFVQNFQSFPNERIFNECVSKLEFLGTGTPHLVQFQLVPSPVLYDLQIVLNSILR
jgi:hypothetical protein